MDFQQIFRIYFSQEDLELIRFWGYPLTTNAVATLVSFLVLKFVGVPQLRPIIEFSPNFQDMLPKKGSAADKVLENI